LPLFVTVISEAELVVFTTWFPKLRLPGLRLMDGAVPMTALPCSDTIVGLFAVLLLMMSVAV